MTDDRRRQLRLVAAGIVVVAFLALAALALGASRSSFSIAAAEPRSELPDLQRAPVVVAPAPGPARRSAPTSAPAPQPVRATAAPAAPPDGPPPSSPLPAPLPEDELGTPCVALGLPAPDEVGGLQSLIQLVPFFGPFSAEAFAMMPAFEPGFDVLGPLFPVAEQLLEGAEPVVSALLPGAQAAGQLVFDAIGPLYAPFRDGVLAAEAQLAASLAPIVEQLATAPGTECVIALEGVLGDALSGAP